MKNLLLRVARVNLNLNHVRLGLAALSLVALALGGSASAYWD